MVFLGHGIKLVSSRQWWKLNIKSKNNAKSWQHIPQCTPTATHSSHTHMSSDSTNRLYCTHTHRYRRVAPACIAPELASRRGRCWSKCHGWVNPKKEGTTRQHWWAELLLSAASCLDAAARGTRGHERGLRGQTWGIQQLEESMIGTLSHPRFGHYSTPIWRAPVLAALSPTSPSSPPETSSVSHADEPRDHPHTHIHYNCTSTHNGKGPHMHTNSDPYTHTHTHSLSWRVKQHKSRHAQPMSLSGELIIMAMKGEGREEWEIAD